MTLRIIIIALLLVVIVLSVRSFSTGKTAPTVDQAEAVYDNILSRSSIRSYESRSVEKEKIEKLLKAGMAAPSAANRQPWHLVAITDKDVLQKVADANPNAGFAAKAPLVIVVCGDTDQALPGDGQAFWVQDCSAVSENILLAAHAMGLGAVWTGFYPIQERCRALADVLGLPSNIVPLNAIVIGYPKAPGTPKDKWDAAKVSYNHFGGKE